MHLPPGPSTSALRQTLAFAASPYGFLTRCHRELGDYFTLRLIGQPPMVWIADADAVRAIFSLPRDGFRNASDDVSLVIGDRSVLFMDGDEHRRERQLLMPAFHGERMRLYGEAMRDAAKEGLARWPRHAPVTIRAELHRVTLRVITQCVFGAAEGPTLDRLQASLSAFLEASFSPSLNLASLFIKPASIRRFIEKRGEVDAGASWLGRARSRLLPLQGVANHRAEVDRLLFEEIARCRRDGPEHRSDILATLAAARSEDGRGLTDAELRDELLTLLMAGHETTATTLAWAVHHVIRAPRVRRRLVAELDLAFPDGVVRPEAVGKLEYLKAVVNETLRLSPVAVAVGRRLLRPAKLGRYELAADTYVLASVLLAHRSGAYWERPEAFEPERFLSGDPSPFQFFPFGGGVRRCVGLEFARYQLRIALAQLFRSAAIDPVEGADPEPCMRGALVGLTDAPVWVRDREGRHAA
jgi:cytochrome P450